MARVGLVAPIFQFWDRPSAAAGREFDHAVLKNDTQHPFVVQCEQFKTSNLLLERLRKLPNVEVLFDHEVVDVAQAPTRSASRCAGRPASPSHSGGYLIGADGGRSTVRKQSGIKFEGFTWPERFIVLTTPFDFAARARLLLPQLFRRPRRVVQLLQGLGRRPARPVAHGLSGQSGAERRRHIERHRRAGAHPVVFSVRQALRDRRIAISM